MPVAPIDIANSALSKLGAELLTSLTEDNDRAVLFNALYEQVRDATLEAFPWSFALKRTTLAQSASTPTFDWAFAYPLPADCLKVEKTDEDDYPWTVETIGGTEMLFSDRGSMKVKYIFQVTDTAKFSPTYVEALTEHMASEMAMGITGKSDLKKLHYEIYAVKIKEARTRASQQKSADIVEPDDLITHRFS